MNITVNANERVQRPGCTRRLLSLAGLAGVVLSSTWAIQSHAQTYPSRNITIVIPSSAGAPSDLVGRLIGKSIGTQAKSPVVVDNKPGANGIIGVQHVTRAPADGYTILLTTSSPIALNKHLYKTLPYDAQAELIPIGIFARSTQLVAVNSKLPIKSVEDLVATAKRAPAKLNYGYGTTVPQLAGTLFQQKTGAEFTLVPYKSHSAMVLALVSGEVDLSITDTASLGPYVKSGQVRLLATTGPARLPSYPDVPTLRERGIGYELVAWHGLFVKRGTPPEVIARLTEWLKAAVKSPEYVEYLGGSGLDDFLMAGPEVEKYIEADTKRWGEITRGAGIVPN